MYISMPDILQTGTSVSILTEWGGQHILSTNSNYKAGQNCQKQPFQALWNQPKAYNKLRMIYSWNHWTLGRNRTSLWHSCPRMPCCVPPRSLLLNKVAQPEWATARGNPPGWEHCQLKWPCWEHVNRKGQWLHFPVFAVLFEQLLTG